MQKICTYNQRNWTVFLLNVQKHIRPPQFWKKWDVFLLYFITFKKILNIILIIPTQEYNLSVIRAKK